MLKFLRKYNKFILVVFGSILMVAFLVPQAIQQFGQHPDGPVQARLDGVALRDRQMGLASRELIVLERLGVAGGFGIEEGEDAEGHWIMLVEEARRAGLLGGAGDGADLLPILEDQLLRQAIQSNVQLWLQLQRDPSLEGQLRAQIRDTIAQAAGEAGFTEHDLHMALAKARGVLRMFNTFEGAARMSDKRAELETKEVGDRALVNLLVIPASTLTEDVPEPTEEELAAHFEKYRDVAPNEGEHVGVGYLLPPRVKFEVLKIDQEAIKEAVKLDPIEVRTFWERNKDRFGEDFNAAKERVEDELAGIFAQDVQQTALRVLRTEVYRATQGLPEADGVKVLPPDWERPHMEDLAGKIVEEVEASLGGQTGAAASFEMPRPEVMVYASRFHTPEDLAAIADLRQAQISIGNRPLPLPQALFDVRELSPESPLDIQVGVPVVTLPAMDRTGSRYYFTVLDARERSPAESLDEVREKVVEDYKRLSAYERLQGRASEFLEVARNGDLDAVAAIFAPENPEEGADAAGAPTVRSRVVISAESRQFGQQYPEDEAALREQVLEAASAIDPTTALDEYPPEQSLLAVELPQQTAVALVDIMQNQPLTVPRLRTQFAQATMRGMIDELIDAGAREAGPYSFDALASRLNWEYVGRRETAAVETDEGAE